MKRTIMTVAILAMAAGVALAGVSKEDIRKLVSAGVGDDVIVAFVKANGPVDALTADDLIDLKKAGASEKLLQAILATKEKAASKTTYEQLQAYQPPSTVERETVYVPSTTYYYPYSYYYPYYGYSPYYYPRFSLGFYYYPRHHYYYSGRHYYPRHYSYGGHFSYHRGGASHLGRIGSRVRY